MRRFLVVGNKAASAPGFSRKDLAGTGGRLDILVRCVPAALLVSHGLRPEVELTTLHLGPPTPSKAVRFSSPRLKHLNPDEHSTASLLERALGAPTTGPVWQEASPGVETAVLTFSELLDDVKEDALFVLDERGEDVASVDVPPRATFVLGDHLGLADDARAELAQRGARAVSIGPTSLQADQCIVVLHNHLDRRT